MFLLFPCGASDPMLLPFSRFACVFRPLEGLPSPTVVVFCISDYFQVVGVSWGEPHDEAKKPSETYFYVFQLLLGVRGRVFEVFVTPMRCIRSHIVVILEVRMCFPSS